MSDALARRRSLPPGALVEAQVMADGWPVHSLRWPAGSGAGSILFLTGRADFAEKYAESFHDLVDAGWGVATFDWRGQGRSGRQGRDAMVGDAPAGGFDTWVADLETMVGWFHRVLPPPWFAIGHSMGGHLLLRHLAGPAPGFERAVLLAPMLGVLTPPLPAALARTLARAMVGLGFGHRYVAGGGANLPRTPGSSRQMLLTTDADRYGDEGWWVEQDAALALGSATWGWLAAAFDSLATLTPPVLHRIGTPLLVMVPAIDALVDNGATRAVVAALPAARLETVAAAGHELLREASDIRARVLARGLDFLQNKP